MVSANLQVQKDWGIRSYFKKVKLLKCYLFITRWFGCLLALLPNIKVFSWLYKMFAKELLVGYVGDIAIYTSIDVKSKHYETRKQILNGALSELKGLLTSENNYYHIVLAGNSLGSVIAFDALNKLNLEANSNEQLKQASAKIKTLITFGSPLDKTAFFFRDISDTNQYIRRQLLNHLYSFKVKEVLLKEGKEKIILENSLKSQFEHINWYNFYHANDPVSGHLNYYEVNDNIVCKFVNKDFEKFGIAHLGYWEHAPMYQKILSELS